jgi:hypothetical protein
MGERLQTYLPRAAVLVLVGLAATAGLTYAAGQQIATSRPPAATTTTTKPATLVVPDLRNQAFVFAKEQLQDGGFAWKVEGGVQGFAANTVVSQTPAPGTKLIDTGSPLVVVRLARNSKYAQVGTPADASPYVGTPLRLADVASAPAPKVQQPTAKAAPKQTASTSAATTPAARPPDFVVPGARKEPLDEISLPARAAALGRWLDGHRKPTNPVVKYWLYQNAWIVAGARMGWWHGAQALQTLIAVDRRTESVWGIGAKSRNLAVRALAEVQARKQ